VSYEEGCIVLSRKLIKRQPRRKLITYTAVFGLLVLTFGIAGAALAVHELDFQLDGNTATSCPTPPGSCTSSQKDWDDLFTVTTGGGTQTVTKATPISTSNGDFTTATFTRDFLSGANCTINSSATGNVFCTGDTSTFATGSKDTLDITTGWACNFDHNVNSKIDIMNAYSASYTQTSNGHKLLYFGLEKNKDNGTNDAGFWFLQGDSTCDASGGGHPNFTGSNHHIGDILVVAEYSRGGGVGNITAYRWDGTTPLVQIANLGVGLADCKTQLAETAICGTTNSGANQFNGNITTSWRTSDATLNVGNTVVPPDFFEGGIDLTAAFLASGGGTVPTCFNTFIADTRSSTSLTATLFDYARGRLGECTSGTTTSPVDATDTSQPPASSIPAAPAAASVTVKDKAVLTVTGIATFDASIAWHICKIDSGTCDTGGVDLGSTGVTTAGTYYSPTVTLTAAGRYCFRADFSGDSAAGVPDSSDHSSGECFTIAAVTPTISTAAVASPVDFGNAVQDNATLSGTANEPGTGGTGVASINPTALGGPAQGNITFRLLKSDCTTLATGTGSNPQTVAINGNGPYGPVSFTPDAPGTYYWAASYPGDPPNTNAATDQSACPANSEQVIVRQIPTSILSDPFVYPNDSATIGSTINNLAAGGTVQFRLFSSLTNCTNGAAQQTVGQGGLLYKQSFTPVGGAATESFSTTNTSVSVSSNSTVYWRVTYAVAAGDTAHTGRQSACVENTGLTFASDAGPGTLFP